jgi:hypothetical protein
VGDFKHKLWDHLALIADFELDIDSPYPRPEREKFEGRPNEIPYSQGNIRYLHYGRIVELLIDAVAKKEDGDEKEYLTSLIVNQMKKSYITWNRGQVADEVIFGDLKLLSGGKLKVTDGVKLLEIKDLLPQVRKKPQQGKQHGKQQNKYSNKKKGFNRV